MIEIACSNHDERLHRTLSMTRSYNQQGRVRLTLSDENCTTAVHYMYKIQIVNL